MTKEYMTLVEGSVKIYSDPVDIVVFKVNLNGKVLYAHCYLYGPNCYLESIFIGEIAVFRSCSNFNPDTYFSNEITERYIEDFTYSHIIQLIKDDLDKNKEHYFGGESERLYY